MWGCNKQWATYHADFEGIEQVKRQSGHQVDDKPRGQVMDAYLSSVKNDLAGLADIRRAKIEDDIWQLQRKIKVWVL